MGLYQNWALSKPWWRPGIPPNFRRMLLPSGGVLTHPPDLGPCPTCHQAVGPISIVGSEPTGESRISEGASRSVGPVKDDESETVVKPAWRSTPTGGTRIVGPESRGDRPRRGGAWMNGGDPPIAGPFLPGPDGPLERSRGDASGRLPSAPPPKSKIDPAPLPS
jgi:hypothetical protein